MAFEPYVRQGIAIINPYGGIWTNEIFKTPEEALAFLKSFWKGVPEHDISRFRLAMAIQTTTVWLKPGEPEFFPMPQSTASQ